MIAMFVVLNLKAQWILQKGYSIDHLKEFLWVLFPAVILNAASHVYTGYLNSMNRFIIQTVAKNVSGIATVIMLYFLIEDKGVYAIALTYLLSVAVILSFQLFDLYRQ